MSQLINAHESVERQNEKLLKITEVLMNRVEQVTNDGGAAYAQFQRAVMLEDQVRTRTRELEEALNLLNESNAQLSAAIHEAETSRKTLTDAIETIREGFALFDAEDRLMLHNSRFGMFMPDVRERLRPGLTFDQYVDLVSRSRMMDLPEGLSPADWAKRRRKRHKEDHVVFNVAVTGDRWIQVSEHRTEGRQTAILQTDVTEIVRIERRERMRMLDDQARLIAATLDHLDQGVAVFDRDRVLVHCNDRLNELLGLSLTDLRHGASAETLIGHLEARCTVPHATEALAKWIEGRGPRDPVALELTREPGVVLSVSGRAMPDGGFVISFTDITAERNAALELLRAKETLERRVMERTLELEDALAVAERANASKSRFVAAASHDLLQPLSAAKLMVSSLAPTGQEPGGEREIILDKTKSALESVEDMIGALLAISKLETDQEVFDIRPVSLGALLRRLETEFQPLAAEQGIDLTVVPSSAWVMSDPTYLRRIVQNLIGNAVRYTETGRVVVGVRRRMAAVRIEVHDTGPGIPEEAQSAIFEEFKRLSGGRRAGEGLGLGLAIVDRACGALGHPLTLRSEPGKGSCFAVTAPLTGAPQARPKEGQALGAADARTLGQFVLIVDDDAEFRDALEYAMTGMGHHVLTSGSPYEALDLIEEMEVRPDHILLDYRLGESLTALDCLDDIRARLPDTPICVLTASRCVTVQAKCEARGLGFEHKPVDAERLDQHIRTVAARQ